MNSQFSNDWFERTTRPEFEKLLARSEFKDWSAKKILEIGCYEGRSMCYWGERFPGVYIVGIDSYDNTPEFDALDINLKSKLSVCIHNTKHLNRFLLIGKSREMLPTLRDTFDIAYIDGSHIAEDVLLDGLLSAPLVRLGGLIIFDDYQWCNPNSREPKMSPRVGIDAFGAVSQNFMSLVRSKVAIFQRVI